MKTNIQHVIAQTWGLMMSTLQTWESIVSDKNEKSFQRYFLPLLIICAAVVLVFNTIYASSKPIQTGFVYAVVTLIAYVSTFYFTRYFTNSYLVRNHVDKSNPVLIQKMVAYSFAVVFPIKLITTIIPSLFFLQILNIYTVYIVWEGCRIIFDMDEDERGKIMLIVGLSIMFLPAIISKIILRWFMGFRSLQYYPYSTSWLTNVAYKKRNIGW